MSLINSILGQKMILLLVGGILLIFLVAVGLNFVVAIRAAAKRRAKRKAAEKARVQAVKKARAKAKAAQLAALEANKEVPEQAEPTLADELGEAAVLVVSDDAQAVVGEALTPPSVTMAGPTANAPAAAAILPSMPVQALGGAPADQTKKETDKASEIQSMLADVFEDEESNGRYELLMGDAEPIPADDLLAQINKIAKQLGTSETPKAKDEVDRKESRTS